MAAPQLDWNAISAGATALATILALWVVVGDARSRSASAKNLRRVWGPSLGFRSTQLLKEIEYCRSCAKTYSAVDPNPEQVHALYGLHTRLQQWPNHETVLELAETFPTAATLLADVHARVSVATSIMLEMQRDFTSPMFNTVRRDGMQRVNVLLGATSLKLIDVIVIAKQHGYAASESDERS